MLEQWKNKFRNINFIKRSNLLKSVGHLNKDENSYKDITDI